MSFIASLRSELLKIKRTPLLHLVLLAAFVVPLIMVFDPGSANPDKPGNNADQFYREAFMVFVFVFLPLFYVLASTLLMQIEARNHAWKQVLAAPQSFIYILLAKFLILQLLGISFLVVFNGYMILSAAVIEVSYGFDYLTYLQNKNQLLKLNGMAYVSNMGMSALSFWLALRYKNFMAPIALGFLLWLTGPLVAFEFKWPCMDRYVSALPFTIVQQQFEQERMFYLILSMGYAMLFFACAYVEFVAKRVKWRRVLGKAVE